MVDIPSGQRLIQKQQCFEQRRILLREVRDSVVESKIVDCASAQNDPRIREDSRLGIHDAAAICGLARVDLREPDRVWTFDLPRQERSGRGGICEQPIGQRFAGPRREF